MRQHHFGKNAELQETLTDLIRRASRMMNRCSHRNNQVPHAQHRVLKLIKEQGPISQGELLELLDVRSSSLSELLRKLETNGYIIRKRNEADKRGFILSINEAWGGEVPDGDEISSLPQDAFSCLSEVEQQQLQALLTKVVVHMGERQQGRGGPGKGHRRHLAGRGQKNEGGPRPFADTPIRGWGRRKS